MCDIIGGMIIKCVQHDNVFNTIIKCSIIPSIRIQFINMFIPHSYFSIYELILLQEFWLVVQLAKEYYNQIQSDYQLHVRLLLPRTGA